MFVWSTVKPSEYHTVRHSIALGFQGAVPLLRVLKSSVQVNSKIGFGTPNVWRSSKSHTTFLTLLTNILTFPQWEKASAGTGQPATSLKQEGTGEGEGDV